MYDVIIVGGSYAGLSAAMALGRSLKKTLVIDSGKPSNRQTPHSHNFLTGDGQTPKELATIAREQVENYETVTFYGGIALSGQKTKGGFEINTQSNETFFAKKVIFATGIKDEMLSIPGFADCWGISVMHCPYCQGYEYRNQKTGILAKGDRAFHLASLLNKLTQRLTILTQGIDNFKPEQIHTFKQHGIEIEEQEIVAIEHQNGYLEKLMLKDGSHLELDAMYASVAFTQTSDIPSQ